MKRAGSEGGREGPVVSPLEQSAILIFSICFIITTCDNVLIARAGVKFGINCTRCSENGNFAVIATSGINFTPASAITN